jgi:hypothetical protein
VEFFASLPTEREFIDLICRTVAEVERGRLEWLSARARARRARRWFVPQFPAYQGSVTDGRRRRRAENRQFRPILGLPGVAKRRGNVGPVPQKSLGFARTGRMRYRRRPMTGASATEEFRRPFCAVVWAAALVVAGV